MRTTVTLDDDVAALIESERARTGESFRDALNRLLARKDRLRPMPFALALFDINHFKAFYDEHGHLAGDALP